MEINKNKRLWALDKPPYNLLNSTLMQQKNNENLQQNGMTMIVIIMLLLLLLLLELNSYKKLNKYSNKNSFEVFSPFYFWVKKTQNKSSFDIKLISLRFHQHHQVRCCCQPASQQTISSLLLCTCHYLKHQLHHCQQHHHCHRHRHRHRHLFVYLLSLNSAEELWHLKRVVVAFKQLFFAWILWFFIFLSTKPPSSVAEEETCQTCKFFDGIYFRHMEFGLKMSN